MDVAILGCGYVGLELGRQLRPSHTVFGIRRSTEGLEAVGDAGLEPIRADVTDPETLDRVPSVDAVVFAASARRGTAAARSVYNEGLLSTVEHFGDRDRRPDRFIYTSSTGVYGDHGGDWVDESTPIEPSTDRQEILHRAERIALEETATRGMAGTVARFGGLYGPGRYRLERYLAGPITEGFLNLVHRDDAAGAVAFLLESGLGEDAVVLVVDEEPVDRVEFARWLAAECGVEPPEARTVAETLADTTVAAGRRHRIAANKRCSSSKLRSMGYEFRFPTAREGYAQAVESWVADE